MLIDTLGGRDDLGEAPSMRSLMNECVGAALTRIERNRDPGSNRGF